MKKTILALSIIIFFSYWGIRYLFVDGFFPMHDDTQVGRVVAMGRALRNGQFPVRWVSDLGYGYGYPLFNFYGPFPYYVGGYFYMLGVSGLVATKIMFVTGVLLSGVFMYVATRRWLGASGGIVAALFYMYAPYHAVQIYIRGAVGEFWAIAFMPLILYGLAKIYDEHNERGAIFVGAIGLAGMILSHTILGYAATVLLTGGAVVLVGLSLITHMNDIKRFRGIFFLIAVGLGISAFFWLPAVWEMHYTQVAGQISSSADFHDHFVCFPQLWDSPWGYGGSAKGCADGLSFKLGKVHVLLSLIALFLWFLTKKRAKNMNPYMVAFIATGITSVVLMMPISRLLWEILPYFSYIQYPWRFLGLTAASFSVLSATVVPLSTRSAFKRIGVSIFCSSLVILVSAKLFTPQYMYTRPQADFERTEELRYRVSKISDEYLPPDLPVPAKESDIVHDTIPPLANAIIEKEVDTETYVRVFVTTKTEQILQVNRVYFPGWHYFINGQEVQPEIVHGLPQLIVPAFRSAVELRFTDTPIRTLGNIISIGTILAILFVYGKNPKKTYA